MNSNDTSPRLVQMSWLEAPARPDKPLFSLTIPGRLPSWNEILGMEQWQRYQFKKELAGAFLSALRATANGSSMKTTSAASTLLTYADTLESYLAMRQAQRRLKSRKRKWVPRSRSGRSSKSISSKVPF